MPNPESIRDLKILTYSKTYLVTGFLVLLCAVFIGLAGLFAADTTTGKIVFSLFTALFALLGIYILAIYKNSVVLYGEEGIITQDVFKRQKKTVWNEIRGVTYGTSNGLLKLRTSAKTITISRSRIRFKYFTEYLEQKLHDSALEELQQALPQTKKPAVVSGINTEPILTGIQAINEKEKAAQLLVGLAFLQFGLAIILFAIALFVKSNTTLTQLFTILLVSSVTYVLAGSLLFKFNSRILGALITLYALVNLLSAFAGAANVGALFFYFIILWSCGRATYAIYLIHKKWPELIKVKNKFPKWFLYLYGLIVAFVILSIGAFVLGFFMGLIK